MKLQAVLGVLVLTLAGIMAAKMKNKRECPACDPAACEKPDVANCLAGTTKDQCDCCDVCATEEGQACDPSADRDMCGDGLECRDSESTGPICQCKYQEIMCGTDNVTYPNLCQLLSTAVRLRKINTLRMQRVGPCDTGAHIVTKPEYVRNHTKSNVVLQCEAMGLPTPAMAWLFTRADNQTYNVPGDDLKVVTSSRGGPGKYMVTSWLQIEGLEKVHEGDYTCVAINQQRTDRAKARIKVVENH